MKKRILLAITLLTIVGLTACSGQAPQTPPAPTQAVTQLAQPPASTASPSQEETTSSATETSTAAENRPASVSFANDIMPILEARCIKCHGIESKKEGLDLQTYDNIFAGSRNGLVIEPGNAADSLLVQLIVKGKMPNRGPKVTADELQLITDWINEGAQNN